MMWLADNKAFFFLQPAPGTGLEVLERSVGTIAQNANSEHWIPTEIM